MLKVINHGTNNKTALFLSGGLDSNLIAAIAKNSNKEVILYTCGYELQKGDIHSHDFFRDESSMALQTAKELGMPIVKVDLSRDDRTAYGKCGFQKLIIYGLTTIDKLLDMLCANKPQRTAVK